MAHGCLSDYWSASSNTSSSFSSPDSVDLLSRYSLNVDALSVVKVRAKLELLPSAFSRNFFIASSTASVR